MATSPKAFHAEQPELVELIEGGMGEHVVSLMVVARTADIGMEDRHAVRAALSGVWRSKLLSRIDLTEP